MRTSAKCMILSTCLVHLELDKQLLRCAIELQALVDYLVQSSESLSDNNVKERNPLISIVSMPHHNLCSYPKFIRKKISCPICITWASPDIPSMNLSPPKNTRFAPSSSLLLLPPWELPKCASANISGWGNRSIDRCSHSSFCY